MTTTTKARRLKARKNPEDTPLMRRLRKFQRQGLNHHDAGAKAYEPWPNSRTMVCYIENREGRSAFVESARYLIKLGLAIDYEYQSKAEMRGYRDDPSEHVSARGSVEIKDRTTKLPNEALRAIEQKHGLNFLDCYDDEFIWPRENPGRPLVVEAIRSKHGPSYKLRISGHAGRIEVSGETGTFFLGLGEVTWSAVMDNTQSRIHRAGGGALPPGAMRKVQDAVYAKLQTLETNPGRKRGARRNPKMAKRYIGDATISISLQDDDSYAGTISVGRKRWKFDSLHAPRAGLGAGVAYDSAEAYDEMAQAAVSFGSYYTSHNRGDDTPDWAPPASTADAIDDGAAWAMEDDGRYEVRRSKAKANPSRRRGGPTFTYTGTRAAQVNRGPKGGAIRARSQRTYPDYWQARDPGRRPAR